MQLGRVPTYVPDSAPPKILTIGRAMNLFRHHDRVAHRGRAPVDTGGRPSSRGGATDVATGAARSEVLITDEDLKGISQQLSRVASAPVFSGAAVAHAIDVIHDKVRPVVQPSAPRMPQRCPLACLPHSLGVSTSKTQGAFLTRRGRGRR